MLSTWKVVLDRLPSTCQVCGAWPGLPVCARCQQRFAAPVLRCPACAAPMASGAGRCGRCLAQPAMPDLQDCVAAVDYAFPWDDLVARFKFRDEPGWAGLFSELIWRQPAAQSLVRACTLMAPVPVTPQRLGERGYNQAWELVKGLSKCASREGGDCAHALAGVLVRTGESPDQHSLGRQQRLKNLRGAFLVHPDHLRTVHNAEVLLVDDVTTTGATLQTAAETLIRAGAARVSALVFARTPVDLEKDR